MTALSLLRWLKRSGVALRLVYSRGAWRLGVEYPDGQRLVFAGQSLAHHVRMLARMVREDSAPKPEGGVKKLPCVVCGGLGYVTGIVVPEEIAVWCGCAAGQRLRALPIEWPALPSAIEAARHLPPGPLGSIEAIASFNEPLRSDDVDVVEARRGAVRLIARCSCGAWFDWRSARFVGVQQDDVERIELRTHEACGSTRALVVWRGVQAA